MDEEISPRIRYGQNTWILMLLGFLGSSASGPGPAWPLGRIRRRLSFAWVAAPVVPRRAVGPCLLRAPGCYCVLLSSLLAVRGRSRARPNAATLFCAGRRPRSLIYASVLILSSWTLNAYSSTIASITPMRVLPPPLIFHAKIAHSAEAFAACKTSIMVYPGFADGWNNPGVLEAQWGTLDVARRTLPPRCPEPRSSEGLGNLAALAFREGKRAEADSLARRTFAAATDAPELLMNAGVVLGNLGRFPEALAAFQRLVALEPQNVAVRLGQAGAGRPRTAAGGPARPGGASPAEWTLDATRLSKELTAP